MYGSNSWGGHHRQSMSHHMQNPYGGSSYPNVHYSQSQHYHQQSKSHYGDHNRNDRKSDSRKYQDRMKAMSRDYVSHSASSPQSNQGKSQLEKSGSSKKETDEKKEASQKLEEEHLENIAKKPAADDQETSENKTIGKDIQVENSENQQLNKSQTNPSANVSLGHTDKSEITKEAQSVNKSNLSESKTAVKSIIDGGNLFPFYCEICDAKCNSESNYNDHLKGSRHLRNCRQQESASSEAKRIRLDETATNRDQQFHVENNDPPFSQNRGRFESTSENKENKAFPSDRFSDSNANKGFQRKNESRWIDGNEYPLNTTFEPNQYDDAESNVQNNQLDTEKDKASFNTCSIPGLGDYEDNGQTVDFNNGKSSVDFNQGQAPPTENLEKTEEEIEPNPFEKFLSDDPNNLSLSKGNLGTLLKVLTKCVINNEEDAEMALEVSNTLTKSLLKYRLQNMPADVLSATLQTGKNLWFGENMKNTVSSFKPGLSELPFPGPENAGPPPLPHGPKQNAPLLPTPGSNPVPQHFRPLNCYNQQKYDRY